MDGLINGNPYAVELMKCFEPIAKQSINIPIALLIDLIYGFIITELFMIIIPVLPSGSGIIKGIIFGSGMWFFRVVMNVISSWMMFAIPEKTLIYILFTGLIEMTVLGIINGMIIKK
jgi:hypothetical protein